MSNWFDILLLAVAAATTVLGFIRGLVRQVVGLVAALGGFILAANYYPVLSRLLSGLIGHAQTRDFLSFGLVFAAVVLLGMLLGRFLSGRFRGLSKALDQLLGAAAGLVKGALFCGVLVLAFLVFPADKTVVYKSRLAPLALRVTNAIISLVPRELKDKFKESYNRVIRIQKGGAHGQKV